ncbi:MAG: hypothetical protein ABR953_14380 [Candidatus Acidiferrales bacterium]|jgi:hypothetical protein
MEPVYQYCEPRFVRAEITRFRTTQLVVSGLGGIDSAQFSLFLNSHRGLSPRAQQAIFSVLGFLQALTDESAARGALAPDLTDMSVLRPHYQKWCAARAENEVVRTGAELYERANGESA